jgi:proto-oncogene tyrosine-protein kinase ROS
MAPWSIRRLILQLVFTVAFQFRLVIVLASDREPLTSDESAPVLTLPSGLPSSPPVNLQAVVLDANRISISWDPPHYPNGPLVSYSLNIQEASSRNADSYQGSQVRTVPVWHQTDSIFFGFASH